MGNDPDAGGYKIERRAEDDSSFVFMPIMDLATSCSDTGLISDRMYHYRVSAYLGDLQEYYDYYPFGKIMPGRSLVSGEQPATFKYTGKELDDENALEWYYFGARYYNPEIGRWIVIDPRANDYPNLGSYCYAANNPIIFLDPDGNRVIGFGKSETGGFIIGMTRGYLNVSDDQGWHGFANFAGIGGYVGAGYSKTKDYLNMPNLNTIFELGGWGLAMGVSAGKLLVSGGREEVTSGFRLLGKNQGRTFSGGLGFGTAEGHVFFVNTNVFSLSEKEEALVEKYLKAGFTLKVGNNGKLQVLDSKNGEISQSFDIQMRQINDYVFISEQAIDEHKTHYRHNSDGSWWDEYDAKR